MERVPSDSARLSAMNLDLVGFAGLNGPVPGQGRLASFLALSILLQESFLGLAKVAVGRGQ